MVANKNHAAGTRRRALALVSSLALGLALPACDDGGGAGTDPTTDAVGATDRGTTDARTADAQADAATDARLADATPTDARTGDADLTDAGPVDARLPDAALPVECSPQERACVEGAPGVTTLRTCGPDGRYRLEGCPEGTACVGAGHCLTDPALCVTGEGDCADVMQPVVCTQGAGWTPLEVCPNGSVCTAGGICRRDGCSDLVTGRSYYGCDFTAVDLPNLAYAPLGGTPESPFGVVLTNPDPMRAVRLTARDGAGALATLTASTTVHPSGIQGGMFSPVDLVTEVRDGDGALVDSAFDQANRLSVPPGGMAVLLFPNAGYFERSRRATRAWQLSSEGPLAAYQFGPYCCNFSFTNDASLLLPDATLGTDYVFLGVPSWADEGTDQNGQWAPGAALPATLTVTATRPQTHVRITLPPGATAQADGVAGLQQNGNEITAILDRNEVLDLFGGPPTQRQGRPLQGMDLSGTRIESTRPVSVFSGHLCTNYPWDADACDHLEEQLLPVDTWGNSYVLVPPKLRTETPALVSETTYWKFTGLGVGQGGGTTRITLSVRFSDLQPKPPGFVNVPDCAGKIEGADVLVLAPGEVCEFGTRRAFVANGDAPFSVMGIISGQATTGFFNVFGAHAGDPAIFLPPPARQWRSAYQFLTPTTYYADYVTITAPGNAQVELDGVLVDLSEAEPIPGTNQVFVHVQVEDGPHRISGSAPFAILVYAYDDYVSYVFTGGLALDKVDGRP